MSTITARPDPRDIARAIARERGEAFAASPVGQLLAAGRTAELRARIARELAERHAAAVAAYARITA